MAANTAGDAGGLYLFDAYPVITNSVIAANVASGGAGGLITTMGSEPTLTNVIVIANQAGATGGGLYLMGYSATLTNVMVVANTSTHGAGIYLEGADPVLTNVVIVGNEAGDFGGGIHANPSSPSISFCNVYGNLPEDYYDLTDPTGTQGNLSVDPVLLDTSDPDPLAWDFHLDTASPLVDAGEPTYLDPDASISDLGIFGGPQAGAWDLDGDGYFWWWQPGPYDVLTYPAMGLDCDDQSIAIYPGHGC